MTDSVFGITVFIQAKLRKILYDGDNYYKMALAVGIGAIWMEYECSHDRWPTSGALVAFDKQIPCLLRKLST